MQTKIPCVLMRGGTSRGPFFLAQDLPSDPQLRAEVLLAAMGSPHEYQVDGIGGANPLTSKVAIISASRHAEADVDYLFVQVLVNERLVDTKPNCGNMLVAVGPFAVECGLVAAKHPETTVRIFNVNTQALVEAIVQTPDGKVEYSGSTAIDLDADLAGERPVIRRAALIRTARRLFEGHVCISAHIWPGADARAGESALVRTAVAA